MPLSLSRSGHEENKHISVLLHPGCRVDMSESCLESLKIVQTAGTLCPGCQLPGMFLYLVELVVLHLLAVKLWANNILYASVFSSVK